MSKAQRELNQDNIVASLKTYLHYLFKLLFFKNQVVNLNIVIISNLGKY